MSRNNHSKTRRKQTNGQNTNATMPSVTQTRSRNLAQAASGQGPQRNLRGSATGQPANGLSESMESMQDGMNLRGKLERGKKAVVSSLASAKDSVQEELSTDFDSARSAVTKAGKAALKTIKANPLPIALAGIGIACAGAGITWLLMSSGKEAVQAAGSGARQLSSSTSSNGEGPALTSRIKGSMKDASKSVKEVTQSVKQATQAYGTKVSQLAQNAYEQGRKLEHTMEETVQAHPLAMGAAFIAVGAAIGLSIPRSKLEDGWLGRERDQIVGAAQKVARGAVQKAESIAKQVIGPIAQA